MIKYLFFDLDGTLSDSKESSLRSILKAFERFGYTFDKQHQMKFLGDRLNVVLKDLNIGFFKLFLLKRAFWKYFTNEANEGNIRLCVPIEPLQLLHKHYPFFIISNSERGFVKSSLNTLGIQKLFDKVYGCDNFSTKEVMMKKLFKKLKVHPREVAYIGDRYSDIDYAHAAGCWAIAIHNKCSWSDLDTVKASKPDFIIRNFSELSSIIKKINASRVNLLLSRRLAR